MARRNKRRLPQRSRTAQKRVSRRTEHIANHQVMPCRMPTDPPSIFRGLDICIKLQVNLVGDPQLPSGKDSGFDNYGSIDSPAIFIHKVLANGALGNGAITSYDISQLVDAYLGSTPATCYTELAIMKVLMWGPSHNSGLFTGNATSFVVLDPGDTYASRSVTDVGTSIHRPRCGLTVPQKVWFCGATTANKEYSITFNPDTSPSTGTDKTRTRWPLNKGAFDLGIMHLTVHVKRCAIPTAPK